MPRRLLNPLTLLSLVLCVATASCADGQREHTPARTPPPLTARDAEAIALTNLGELPPNWRIINSQRDRGRWWVRSEGSGSERGSYTVVEVFDDKTVKIHPGE